MQRALTVGVRSVKAGLKCCHDPSAASRKRRDSPVGMTAVAVTRRGCAQEWEKNSHTPVRRVTHPTCSGRDDKWWRVGEGVSGVDGVGVLPAGSRRYRSTAEALRATRCAEERARQGRKLPCPGLERL